MFEQIWDVTCTYVTPVVAIASIVANYVRPSNPFGAVLHWIAMNGSRTQQAICEAPRR